MHKYYIVIVSTLFITTNCLAQDSVVQKKISYKTTITATRTGPLVKGYLVSIGDSSLYISPNSIALKAYNNSQLNYTKVDYTNIEQVSLKRKGSFGRGLLYGGLIGLGIGAVAGFAAGDDPPCTSDFFGICAAFRTTAGEKAVGLGVVGGVGGGIVGGIIGALSHKKFIIGGNRQNLMDMKTQLVR